MESWKFVDDNRIIQELSQNCPKRLRHSYLLISSKSASDRYSSSWIISKALLGQFCYLVKYDLWRFNVQELITLWYVINMKWWNTTKYIWQSNRTSLSYCKFLPVIVWSHLLTKHSCRNSIAGGLLICVVVSGCCLSCSSHVTNQSWIPIFMDELGFFVF